MCRERESFYFMDNETYDQVAVPADFIGEKSVWFKENDNAQLLYADTALPNPPKTLCSSTVIITSEC